MKSSIPFALFFVAVVFLWLPKVQALMPATSCHTFQFLDSAAMSSVPKVSQQNWCYQKLEHPRGGLFVFNADSEKVRPELSFLLDADGILTHGSLKAGEVSVHKVRAAQFNPFPVPLREPQSISEFSTPDPALEESARQVLQMFLDSPAELADLHVQAGRIIATASANIFPWRGYWWPYRNQPLSGTAQSPMAKYDQFVQARTGANPGVADWENRFHRFKGIPWEGHCNGWAASSIIRREPDHPVRDSSTGIVFSVSDQKGLLAENDYCVNDAFYGRRYRGRPTDDINDIYPADFHKVLTYYLAQLQKPVAMDYEREANVDNHIISGYTMDIRQTSANTFSVKAVLRMHGYDGSASDQPGVASSYNRTYKYTLTVDSTGSVIGGSWNSTNPDFLWVPLSHGECNTNNPRIDNTWVETILTLPPQ